VQIQRKFLICINAEQTKIGPTFTKKNFSIN
jgi:hypothetical protein